MSGPNWRLIVGDCREVLATLPERSVHTVVTSPPYFGLRDYGTSEWEPPQNDEAARPLGSPTEIIQGRSGFKVDYTECDHLLQEPDRTHDLGRQTATFHGAPAAQKHRQYREVCGKCGARRVDRQIGLEPTPDEFVAAMVAVFREVRRVLRDDGTVWLNLGDSYNAGRDGGHPGGPKQASLARHDGINRSGANVPGCKPKDLLGIPWMVAFALRADGWYLRSDIIWAKPNPMPESVTDRPTKAHEYVFLLSKSPRYYFDADAVREKGKDWSSCGPGTGIAPTTHYHPDNGGNEGLASLAQRYKDGEQTAGRNIRSVWTVATQPYAGAHFATFPPKLIEPCILAGCPEGGTVLDPFAGAGTTGVVALRNGRDFVGIELNPEYADLARPRLGRYWVDEARPPEAPQLETLF